MKTILNLLSVALIASACSMKKDMKEMHDNTLEMNKKMSETYDLMKQMKMSTDTVSETANHTYLDMRLNESVKDGFIALDAMNEETSLEAKMVAAAFYYASMEFQLWKGGFKNDNEEHRNLMYKLAVGRFFHDITEYLPQNLSAATISDILNKRPPKNDENSKEDNALKNLYALAGVMHELNPNQEIMAKEKNFKPVSFFDVLVEGVNAIAEEKAGKNQTLAAPEYIQIIAQNEERLKLMLGLRYNLLAIKSIIYVAGDISNPITLGKMMMAPWEASFAELSNSSKLGFAIKVTKGAVLTRLILNKFGIRPVLPTIVGKGFQDILNNMTVPAPKNISATAKPVVGELVKSLTELKKH
ncbi:MAG: hypothetical protein SGJ18_12065 [Pseudomonadota bacterium]|nr:hypothetical protein [Pseudomonadota bacterium]